MAPEGGRAWSEAEFGAACTQLGRELWDLQATASLAGVGWRKDVVARLPGLLDAFTEIRRRGVDDVDGPRCGDRITGAALELFQHDLDFFAEACTNELLAKRVRGSHAVYRYIGRLGDEPARVLYERLLDESFEQRPGRRSSPCLAELGVTAVDVAASYSLEMLVAALRGLHPHLWESYTLSGPDLVYLGTIDHNEHLDRTSDWLGSTPAQRRERFTALGFLDRSTPEVRETALVLLDEWTGTLGALLTAATMLALQ